ncbi:hypothetical protein CYCME_0480 [Cycloclasticus zancles 78-ME]|uniref:Uncharacterized protein n=1 Tax=Cycloclasticus zancles 78-ME TaxID=1198232 RepID=S5T4V0_9GAMM|nr:hypothetical protein CYCME_0480 [Cycloclasticus zancles 78-ME]
MPPLCPKPESLRAFALLPLRWAKRIRLTSLQSQLITGKPVNSLMVHLPERFRANCAFGVGVIPISPKRG